MNLLWAEADSIIDKAMDGKSTYLTIKEKVESNWTARIYRGTEFWFYTGSHGSTGGSPLYGIYDSLPSAHNQSSYDTAAAGATISSSVPALEVAKTSATLNLDKSLKAHTRTVGSSQFFLWEDRLPHPEKRWKYAIAELILGTSTAVGDGTYKYEFSNTYDKFNCFKIHNLTSNDIVFYFGTSSSNNYSLTIPKYSQKCVRRDDVSSGYDSTYKYFFKCNSGDPRYLNFNSHDGSVAKTMRANNLTNASFLYNIIEHVGGDGFTRESVTDHHRIAYDPHVWTDVTTEYVNDGLLPAVNNTTNLAHYIFTKGFLSYYRATAADATPQVGTLEFNSFSGLTSQLSSNGLSGSVVSDEYVIAKSSSYLIYVLWGKTTNLLINSADINNAYLLGSSDSNVTLQTKLYYPPHYASPVFIDTYQNRDNEDAYDGTDINLSEFWSTVEGDLDSNNSLLDASHASGRKELILTTEGPMVLYVEAWKLHNYSIAGGLQINNYYDVIDDGAFHRILVKQAWPIHSNRSRTGSSNQYRSEVRKGWPSKWTNSYILPAASTTDNRGSDDAHEYHRMFEGPKKVRRYETTSGNFPHIEITNDPAATGGQDFGQNDTASLADTEIKVQTSNIQAKVTAHSSGDIDTPNYPRMFIGDALEALESVKSSSTTYAALVSAGSLGSPQKYSRLNLLKEHYNDLVTALKKCTQIRPLCFDEIYWGNSRPRAGHTLLFGDIAPMDCYAGFTENSGTHEMYSSLGISVKDKDDLPDDIYDDLHSTDQSTLDDWRWVKIADVKTKAAALGFKFRIEEMVTPLKYLGETGTHHGTSASNGWFDTTNVEADSKWKFPTSLSIITGSTFMAGLSFTTYTIGNGITGITATTVSNRAIKFHLYDTSRTNTTMLKLAYVSCSTSGARDNAVEDFMNTISLTDPVDDPDDYEQYVQAPAADKNYYFHAKVTAPVTHSA
jgi:hypothetical protein